MSRLAIMIYDAADMPAQGWDTDLRQEHELTEAFLTTAGTINPNPQLRFSRDGMRAALTKRLQGAHVVDPAPQLIGIFTQSPEVIATGSRVLRNIMCILPFVGAISMSRMSFQAMGKPQYAFGITLVRQLLLYVPLLVILNRLFGFGGMIKAQPITEMIMMAVSVGLLYHVITGKARHENIDADRG